MTTRQLAAEYPPPNEAGIIADLAERLKSRIIQEYPTGIMRRDAHPKMHGVVKAEFIVEPDLPPEFRVGVFAQPKTYQAWIRFSNAADSINPDIDKDIRGMAIKLMGVPGEKLLEQEEHEQTQDFLVISTAAFLTRDVEQFDGLVKAIEGNLLKKLWFFGTRWRVTWNFLKSSKRFANVLQIRYFSATPYLLGSNAVKYSAIPHVDIADRIPGKPGDNYLREAMIRQLSQGDAYFDFAVQKQADPYSMPIEDSAKEWSESESPFQTVATIRILKQEFDSEKQREFGENLSYSPWHSLPEHRPLGGLNRARKVVYALISTFRHRRNDVPRREPTSWEI